MKSEATDHLTEDELHEAASGPPGERGTRAANRHLEACDSCASDVARIRDLLAISGSLPRSIEPPGDLWPAIQARLAAASDTPALGSSGAGVAAGASPRAQLAGSHRRAWRDYAWLAAAALLLIVATSAITSIVVRDDRPAVATAPLGGDDSLAGPARFDAVSAEYDRLDRDLARRLDEHRAKLQPETIEKVERNLEIIDRAIGEIRQALADDPSNEALEQLLKASYGQKSALLQQVSQS